MSKVPNAPPDDIFMIDLGPYQVFLVDLPAGAMVGMRHEQEGWPAVVQEVTGNQPTYGDRAGITATDFNKFSVLNDQHHQILVKLPQVEKAVEVLTESLAHIDNQRHRLATQIADSAEAHAKTEGGDPTLLTAYEKTIAYRAVIAAKAVKTRQKNEEAKKAQGAEVNAPTKPMAATGAMGATEPKKAGQSASKVPNPPPSDIFQIDLNPLKAFLVDLPPGATVGMRREQEGWPGVAHEIISNQPTYGDRAGVTTTDFDKFVALNAQYEQILAQLPVVEKAVEVLTESLAHLDNQRHRLVTQMADAAEAHAKTEGGASTLLTAYEKTIAYRAVIASKAAKTRKKNEEKKAEAAKATGAGTPPAGTPPTGTP